MNQIYLIRNIPFNFVKPDRFAKTNCKQNLHGRSNYVISCARKIKWQTHKQNNRQYQRGTITIPNILASLLYVSVRYTHPILTIGESTLTAKVTIQTQKYLYSYLFLIVQNDIPAVKIMSTNIINISGVDRLKMLFQNERNKRYITKRTVVINS